MLKIVQHFITYFVNSFTNHLKVACPSRCTKCKTGNPNGGGLPIDSNGICRHFCSKSGYCGNGEAYKTGFDCSGCGADTSKNLLTDDKFESLSNRL